MNDFIAVLIVIALFFVFFGIYLILDGPETFIDGLKKRRLKEQQWREKMAERKRLNH